MTKPFHQTMLCPRCGAVQTIETGFSRWVRSRKDLDSNEVGLGCCDADQIYHRFKTAKDGREVQCLMFVEVKTFAAVPSPSQRDTLVLIDQFLNNQRNTPSRQRTKRQAENRPLVAWSVMKQTNVRVYAFGAYLLQFERSSPLDGWTRWGRKRLDISADQLAGLLRFDLNPETLGPMDFRRHHRDPTPNLPFPF